MKKHVKTVLSLVLIFTLVLSLAGAAFADSSDEDSASEEKQIERIDVKHWAWPGETVSVWVFVSYGTGRFFDKVILETYSESDDSWSEYHVSRSGGNERVFEVSPEQFAPEGEGTAYFRIVVPFTDGGTEYSDPFFIQWTQELGKYRIAGSNRYETALLAADDMRSLSESGKYPNAVIACGTNYADALGGTYLAACYNAPILLVNSTSAVMDQIADTIKSNMEEGGKVFILGGNGAVSPYMEEALSARGITDVVRFAGSDRYETNLKILNYCGNHNKPLLVCSGKNFADALSASALGCPVLLVGNDLTTSQKNYVTHLAAPNTYVLGGTAVVSQQIFDWIWNNNTTHGNMERIYGNDRYITSYKLAMKFYYGAHMYQTYYLFMAYGRNFPDGLSGGALAYQLGAPLLLVDDNHYYYAEYFARINNDCRCAVTLGGPSLISEATVDRIMLASDFTAEEAPGIEKFVPGVPWESDKLPIHN